VGYTEQTRGCRLSIYPARRQRDVCWCFTRRANPTTSRLVHSSDADEIPTIASTSFGSIDALYTIRASAIAGNLYVSFVSFVPTHASVAGEVDSRYTRIAVERDAAPRASTCRPEIDGSHRAVQLLVWPLSHLQSLLPPEADLAMRKHTFAEGS